ncbi:protein MARD1 [Iris pallida]|uniref:Protein MARD1 n=1 Tax=Iris pallida TaxID=29817 RepID=A0AAX6HTF1_IRIPA|nr:protein MARD1 [Iris pallida]
MLKKRSRGAVSSTKQGLMADHHYSIPSPNGNSYTNFPSPRVLVGFAPKSFLDANEIAMSPTSILETKPFSTIANSFFAADKNPRKPTPEPPARETAAHQPVGLGIVDALKKSSSRPDSRMVLFGSQLKIQIPSLAAPAAGGAVDSPKSPIEFGIKNKNSQLALFSPATRRSPMEPATSLVSGSLSATEMEMSEDYTCVIAHGPNPKTTHIFDNCVIESCCGGQGYGPVPVPAAATRKETVFASCRDRGSGYPADDFLTSCHACKKSLEQGKDIFMYRGEKAFCSRECRYLEILFDEGAMVDDCSPPPPDPSAIL